ncbi:MAG: hypothetical protein ACK4YP_06700, partial [Myxococcota bacterium]
RGLLRVGSLEKQAFRDLVLGAQACLDIYVRHKPLVCLGAVQGSLQYLVGVREGRLDRSGFIYLGATVHLAVALELQSVAGVVREVAPEEADVLEAVAELLYGVEGAQHAVYHLLREVGDRHLAVIEECLPAMSPSGADVVLHALDGFVGNEAVAALLDRAIERLPAGADLRQDFRRYLARVRGG